MNGWDREYLQNKDSYQLLFDNIMTREQEASVEFLEESIKKFNIINKEIYLLMCNICDIITIHLLE